MIYFLYSKNNYFCNKLINKLKNIYKEFICLNENNFDILNTYTSNNCKVFFLHWNHIVPKEIYNNYECINIHTSNLPEGKGGSPLQNQIINNILFSKVNTLKITDDGLDSGPIYNSKDISLQGNLFDIWNTITEASYELIIDIINNNIIPNKQISNINVYKRRKNNIIPFNNENNIEKIYDFIRMLDGNDYPEPYFIINNYKLKFSRSKFDGEKILSDVIIEKLI